GEGNYKDARMETLADKGNGNYAYIDNIMEAEKTLVKEFGGTLFTVAKDVKAQIEFNPAVVQQYRLIGYENRMLHTEDFRDDKKDAGDMGAGHTVTLLYELVPANTTSDEARPVNDLKYQKYSRKKGTATDETATIKFRYKEPQGRRSREMEHTINSTFIAFSQADENTRFAAAVALFGMVLKNSAYKGTGNYKSVAEIAAAATGTDAGGYRLEFTDLVKAAKATSERTGAR
ncbi:MAG: DUF3520 domain-containing protein, partial [Taibaiella sp.]|nr:DUF3520 domain-containing protein [Taibaiella sp.]